MPPPHHHHHHHHPSPPSPYMHAGLPGACPSFKVGCNVDSPPVSLRLENLMTNVASVRMPGDSNGMSIASSGPNNAATMMQSGISQAREFDDPAGLHEKTEYLLREWVNMYHSPAAGRDSTKAFTCFVQQASVDSLRVAQSGLGVMRFTGGAPLQL